MTIVQDPWQAVYQQIRRRILAGEIAPSSSLRETRLAEEFGTSRGPVRTALKELERNGLVVQYPRRGVFVREISDDDVDEIFSLWELLWPFAVRRAIKNIGPAELEELASFVPPPPDTVPIDEAIRLSMAFHRTLFRLAEHRRLLEIWDNLTDQARFQLVLTSSAQKRRALGMNPIPTIFAALADGDAEEAIAKCSVWTQKMRAVIASPDTAARSSET
jgi:DNA-binding GntR family transcriptional regulator